MQKEYVILFPYSLQISEDRWQVLTKVIKVTPQTTVAELVTAYRQTCQASEAEFTIREVTPV